eukprot:CAMPEP_0170182304 /NCGR_PEP_ID=MMETSP0040_2-20121228/27478_1 /TAXON_ID=641309 /ORGANISM="Lotharella oceanica, Strain CCMP622" /LENGTH=97 /DNA_ID=CAMNT_0010427667 /DNA_START=527 /DNA_END=821 /DNA_ORIENTATION=+
MTRKTMKISWDLSLSAAAALAGSVSAYASPSHEAPGGRLDRQVGHQVQRLQRCARDRVSPTPTFHPVFDGPPFVSVPRARNDGVYERLGTQQHRDGA